MPDASVGLVVTSPPYNLGTRYNSFNDLDPRGYYLAWCAEWGREIFRVLKADGALFLNVGASPSNPQLPHQMALLFCDLLGFALQNTIVWVKSIALLEKGRGTETGCMVSHGHFKPINSRRFVNDCHETIYHFTKTGRVTIDRLALGVPYADKSNVARWTHTGGRDRRCRGNVWFIPYETIRDRARQRPHPATFPVELAENCIKLHGRRAGLVMLDPFLGLGSSGVAAKRQGVTRFIGFEIDPAYLEIAKQRIDAAERTF